MFYMIDFITLSPLTGVLMRYAQDLKLQQTPKHYKNYRNVHIKLVRLTSMFHHLYTSKFIQFYTIHSKHISFVFLSFSHNCNYQYKIQLIIVQGGESYFNIQNFN